MSTPTAPDEPGDQTTPTEAESVPPGAPAPAAAPPQYQPYPFVPRYKEPWINPAKRATVGVVGAVLGLLLLGGGFIVGAAVAHHHDRQGVTGYWSINGRAPNGRMPQFVQPHPGYRQPYHLPRVGHPAAPNQAPPATPTPAPTKSHR